MAITNLTNYLESSPPVIATVFWTSCALVGIILLLVSGILACQALLVYQRRIGDIVRERWAPVVRAARDGKPYKLPFLPRSHQPQLLELWIQHRQLAQSDQGERLDILARNLKLERSVKSILQPSVLAVSERPVWIQNMALSAVKWLNSHTLLRYVYEAAESSNLYVAVSACRCLTRLRAPDYEQAVISLLFRFPHHSAYIASELSRADVAEILQLMEPFIDDMPSSMATNFISLADKSTDVELLPLLVRRLDKTEEGREVAILVRTLGRMGDSSHRELVIRYLQDHRYYVRIQAIKALGRIGNAEDVELLLLFLSDREWWVRYRTARAIIRLLKRDGHAVEKLRTSLEDRFARGHTQSCLHGDELVSALNYLEQIVMVGILLYAISATGVYTAINLIALDTLREHLRRRPTRENQAHFSGMEPPISVIVPAYNEGATIVSSLHSIMKLDYPGMEIVVVNDGSRDNTLEVLVREFEFEPFPEAKRLSIDCNPIREVYLSKRLDNLRLIDKENGGKADAINAGINLSRSPLFCCIDADSLLEPEALAKVVQPFVLNRGHYGDRRYGSSCQWLHGYSRSRDQTANPSQPARSVSVYRVHQKFSLWPTGLVPDTWIADCVRSVWCLS